MTRDEAESFNRGVAAVLAIAEKAAQAIKLDRRFAASFAVASLAELAVSGQALLFEIPAIPPQLIPAGTDAARRISSENTGVPWNTVVT